MQREMFINLIESIKRKYGITEQEISEALGYHSGHISTVKYRGVIPARLVTALKKEFTVSDHEIREYKMEEEIKNHVAEDPKPAQTSFLDIISRLTRTVESQQQTIHSLVSLPQKKTG